MFGQNPYPRVESATGIAMLDASLTKWEDKRFGSIVSMRNIVKAAAVDKFKFDKNGNVAELRKLLASKKIVSPQKFFSTLLEQGVLLLNASLTASTGEGSITQTEHTKFWAPIVSAIVEEILRAKSKESNSSLVFCWWGDKAKRLRKAMDVCVQKYPTVQIRHAENCNPAAQGDLFSKGSVNPFGQINELLQSVQASPIDFLPDEDAAKHLTKHDSFVASTLDLHAAFLERLADLEHVSDALLSEIKLPKRPKSLADATIVLEEYVQGVEASVADALDSALEQDTSILDLDQLAAVHLYTQPTRFYRLLNDALRSPNRSFVKPFLSYLSVFISALDALPPFSGSFLYRGVGLDLRNEYKKGGTVVWWGVSSTTVDKDVAMAFMGLEGPRTLFVLENVPGAVSVSHVSAMPEESEVIVPPGTQLVVKSVSQNKDGMSTIVLAGSKKQRLVE